eukprot:Sspe_Gene.103698::Locus_79536_Transcript_1_1_Confidence_1.000_Length_938::g.103698::m.103698/K11209/yghU, yfcG; GSH-dependent disulfide-bond oxidoreductase
MAGQVDDTPLFEKEASDLELYFSPTPNGWKVTIALEEMGLPYRIRWLNLSKGDQFRPDFLRISPNNRMPALVDQRPFGGTTPVSLFESGAILLHLAEREGGTAPPNTFLPKDPHKRAAVLQWLFWQVGGMGPMAGQLSHFVNYAPQLAPDTDHSYALRRYRGEYRRLFEVMQRQLSQTEYLAGDYSIADMATWPWVAAYKRFGVPIDDFPDVRRWFSLIKNRPAVRRGMHHKMPRVGPMPDSAKHTLFKGVGAKL